MKAPLQFLLLLSLLLTTGGLRAETPEEAKARIQAERDANREHIEVGGIMYPVYLYMEEAKPKRRAKVAIPKAAKKAGRGGVVLLGTIIGPDGLVRDMTVAMTNAEPDIQEAAMVAVAQWSFPVKYDANDQPIAYAVMVPINVDSTPHFGPRGKGF